LDKKRPLKWSNLGIFSVLKSYFSVSKLKVLKKAPFFSLKELGLSSLFLPNPNGERARIDTFLKSGATPTVRINAHKTIRRKAYK